MPLQYKIDRYLIVGNNMLAFSCMIIWASCMEGSSTGRLEIMVALDLLIGMHVQRYLLTTVHADDTTPYHEPGPMALARRVRRTKLAMIVTVLVCASNAAVSTVFHHTYNTYEHYSDHAEYWFIIAALPAIHASLRTLALDMPGCKRIARAEGVVSYRPSSDAPTNDFAITDDDDADAEDAASKEELDTSSIL